MFNNLTVVFTSSFKPSILKIELLLTYKFAPYLQGRVQLNTGKISVYNSKKRNCLKKFIDEKKSQ
jgi:hypothetical protein